MENNNSKFFKLIYGLSSYSSGLLLGSIGSYLMYYYTDVALVPFALVGSLFFFGKLLNAFLSPIVGLMIDKSESRMGKIKPFLFIGSILVTISTVLIFLTPFIDGNYKIIYVSVVYIAYGISSVIYGTAYTSVFPTLSMDVEQRNKLSIIPTIGGVLGDFTSVGAFFPLLSIVAATQSEGFLRLMFIFAAIFITFNLIFVKSFKESAPLEIEEHIPLKDMLLAILKNDQLLVILLTGFFLNIGIWITTSTALYYFKYNLGNEDIFAVFGILVGLSQVVMMSLFPRLMRKATKKTAFLLAGVLISSGYIIMYFSRNIAVDNLSIVYLGGILLYLGLGITGSIMPIYLADVIDYGEWKYKERNTSTIVSINSLVGTISDALVGLIVTTTLTIIGFKPNIAQSLATLNGISVLLTLVPLSLVIISVSIFMKFYKLNDDKCLEITQALTKNTED